MPRHRLTQTVLAYRFDPSGRPAFVQFITELFPARAKSISQLSTSSIGVFFLVVLRFGFEYIGSERTAT